MGFIHRMAKRENVQAFACLAGQFTTQGQVLAEANASLGRTYQKVIATYDDLAAKGDASAKNTKAALIEAERAWIKWRDAEALMRAYAGGAVIRVFNTPFYIVLSF